MKAQDIANLTNEQLKELMYNICRSGRIVIPQLYYSDHIKNFMNAEPSINDMKVIQSVFESDWTTHEYLDDAVTEIIQNNL